MESSPRSGHSQVARTGDKYAAKLVHEPPAQLAAAPRVHVGTGHQAVAKVDTGWLTGVIERLEAEPRLRPCLTALANNLPSVVVVEG
ncbi:lantibiotic dehydratase [Sphaerimonospora cavernae]|uniref:Lantibiotic dehydratase n=1 Tax=Sphaerimonospora cavernae TaxID=1740611 RepID=A0ABV6U2K2_9ACTN